jgi:hypothetical protein
MAKKMFVVMEVKELSHDPNWVTPIDCPDGSAIEAVRKSRVIYADEMRTQTCGAEKMYIFTGVSPEPEDEFEAWIKECPIGKPYNIPDEYPERVQDWLRRMPREKKNV